MNSGMKRLALGLVALLLGMMIVPLVSSVSSADGLDGLVTAEAESYALRVEYDIPLPAGPGTIPHTVGETRRTSAGENAKGVAGAPTHFDAVVAGEYVNPNHEISDPKKYNRLPQAECFYPGDLVDVAFGFPTDTRDETKAVPPVSHATAECNAGPRSQLDGSVDHYAGVGVSADNLESTSFMRTEKGADKSDTSAHASNISIAGGVVTIGGVDISSASSVTGQKGGAATSTRVSVHDVRVAGVRFSIADDQLVAGSQQVPLFGNAGQAVIDQANTALVASGCRIDVIDNPGRYPQGYLFARPTPKTGLAEDGTFAASMRAGLLVVCDLPQNVTPKEFTPERVQVVVGFAYSAASATADPGGFGLGDLTNGDQSVGALPSLDVAVAPTPDTPVALAPETPTAPTKHRPASTLAKQARFVAVTPLDGVTRTTLLVVCAVAWLVITHLGLSRLRRTS